MKKCFLLIYFLLISSAVFAGSIYENRQVAVRRSGVSAARFGKIVFTDKFDRAGIWNEPVDNYQKLLKITRGKEFLGKPSLYISGEGLDKIDTAWSVRSKQFPLKEKAEEFALAMSFSTDQTIIGAVSSGSTWRSCLHWYDSAGKPCGEQILAFIASPGRMQETILYGQVPKEAAGFSIQLGFDIPNIDEGKYFAVHSVTLSMLDPKGPSFETGWFVSDIFPGGPFSWHAETPVGSSVKFQISTATIKEGVPEKWTPFVGPDGTASSFYVNPFKVDAPFFRYKAYLVPSKKSTPELQSVTVGSTVENQWTLRRNIVPPRVKVVSASPTTNVKSDLVLEITDSIPILWRSLKISIDGKEATARFQRNGNRLTCSPEKEWTDGIHEVYVEISNLNGNLGKSKKCFFIGELPKTPKVTLREDGAVLINGNPFFPIGLYGVMKREFNDFNFDRAFSDLKKAGFNFAHSYSSPHDKDFLAAAGKYGIKLWTVARFPDKTFLRERSDPSILAWYLGDDTSANTTPGELLDRNDAVKAVDPTRLTTQADGVGSLNEVSNYQDYVTGTDSFLPEIYPVRTKKLESAVQAVPKTILDMKRCHRDIADAEAAPRSIWAIIQYFQGWGWERFPTMQELRAMSFASIIHGANGITWYTYGGLVKPEVKMYNYGVTTTQERWNNISTIATQINTLSSVLLERTPKQQAVTEILSGPKKDPLGNEAISCLLKKHDGALYLFCVNSTLQTVRVRLRLDGSYPKSATGTVLFEDRQINLVDSVLTDEFKGYDVHIYKLQ